MKLMPFRFKHDPLRNSHTHRSPDFVLHSVGRHGNAPGAGFWRDYTLTIPDVLDCFIRETFIEGLFEKYDGDKEDGTIWFTQHYPLF